MLCQRRERASFCSTNVYVKGEQGERCVRACKCIGVCTVLESKKTILTSSIATFLVWLIVTEFFSFLKTTRVKFGDSNYFIAISWWLMPLQSRSAHTRPLINGSKNVTEILARVFHDSI